VKSDLKTSSPILPGWFVVWDFLLYRGRIIGENHRKKTLCQIVIFVV
jgi:hypothetical protein